MSVKNKIIQIIKEQFGWDDNISFHVDLSLGNDLGGNNIDVLELEMTLEDEYDIDFGNIQCGEIRLDWKVGDVINIVMNKLEAKNGS